jgi:signal transduction histidine kinase
MATSTRRAVTATRLRSLTGRLTAALHAVRRPVVDVAVVLLTLLLALGRDFLDEPSGNPAVWIFDLALVVPLFWRRRRPTEVFTLIAAIALLQWLVNLPAGGDLALLVALYAVGAYEQRPWRVGFAAVVAEIGVLLAAVRWGDPGQKLDAVVLLSGTFMAAWVLGVYLRTRRAYVSSVLERAATAERERDQQAVIATATERARISAEMHDIVAHSLSVMIALSDGAAIAVARSPEAARSSMLQSSALGRQALAEIRRLLGDLHADDEESAGLAPQPGIADLDDLVDQVRSAGLAVNLVVLGEAPDLSAGAGLTVYRIVQEALTNVLKHAQAATQVVVTLRYHAGGVDIVVENDDRPTVDHPPGTDAQEGTSGHGLSGMRQRAASFGGDVEAARRTDGGWRVSTHLRLDEQDTR